MALKVELKPGERLIIGDCVITNADQRTRLVIDGQAPILREKDILTAKSADTPAKRIYLCGAAHVSRREIRARTTDVYFQARARYPQGGAEHVGGNRKYQ